MLAPVLIFAVGNESRGDDALGPLLLRELDGYLQESMLADQCELLEEYQLQVENAMDMKDRQLVLFVDAGMDTSAPFSFYRAQKNDGQVLYSHALEPEALLNVYEQFYREAAPDVFILCVRGERFELGEGLSSQAEGHLSLAFEFCKKLLREADVSVWGKQCTATAVQQSMSREESHFARAGC